MDIELYKLLWAIAIVIVPPIMKKIWSTLVEGVWVKEYYNIDKVFILTETEGLGALLVHIFSIIVSVVLNTITTDGRPVLSTYIIYWLVWTTLYVLIIIRIVKKKTEHGKKHYIGNILSAIMVNIFIGMDLFMPASNTYKSVFTAISVVGVILIFIWQIKVNVEIEEIRRVEYTVRTKNRKIPYTVHKKPIKSGKYIYISFMDKNNEEVKRIQIPESEILEIVYDIQRISEEKK